MEESHRQLRYKKRLWKSVSSESRNLHSLNLHTHTPMILTKPEAENPWLTLLEWEALPNGKEDAEEALGKAVTWEPS